MLKKKIAVAIGAALLVGTAWTATALAANTAIQPADVQPVAAVTTGVVAGHDGTATVPVQAPWFSSDSTPSVPATGAPFGWTVRMMAQSAEASNTPFGWTVRMLAHMKRSVETTMPAWIPGESFGQWVREWAHAGESVDPTVTIAPHPAGPMTRAAVAKVKARGPKMTGPGATHRAASAPMSSGTPVAPMGSGTVSGSGPMSGSGGMMGSRR